MTRRAHINWTIVQFDQSNWYENRWKRPTVAVVTLAVLVVVNWNSFIIYLVQHNSQFNLATNFCKTISNLKTLKKYDFLFYAHTHTTDHNRYLNIYTKILFNLHWLKAFIVTECEICNFRLPRGLRRLWRRRRRRSTVRNRWRVLTFCWSIAVRCGRSRETVENDKIPTGNVKRRLAVVNTKTLLINIRLQLLLTNSLLTNIREI